MAKTSLKDFFLIIFGILYNFFFIYKFWFNNSADFFQIPYNYPEEGDLIFLFKNIYSFNSIIFNNKVNFPFGTNQISYPITDYFLLLYGFILSNFFKPYMVFNLLSLSSNVLAYIFSYFSLKTLKVDSYFSFFLSLLFATCHFIFLRQFDHLNLSFIFLIPFSFLILRAIYLDDDKIINSKIVLVLAVLQSFYSHIIFLYIYYLF